MPTAFGQATCYSSSVENDGEVQGEEGEEVGLADGMEEDVLVDDIVLWWTILLAHLST